LSIFADPVPETTFEAESFVLDPDPQPIANSMAMMSGTASEIVGDLLIVESSAAEEPGPKSRLANRFDAWSVYPTTAAISDFAAASARATSAFASTSGLESCMASASVRPSFRTRCLRIMNGTFVLRAAWATVANSSALLNPSAATCIRAPRFNTGFSLSCNRGSDAGIALVTVFGVAVLAAAVFRFVAVALARGVLAGVGVAAGSGVAAATGEAG
jgi:hypothetical protein